MLKFSTFTSLILFFCIAIEHSSSQTRTGSSTISGIVSDSVTKSPLFNANVFLQSTTRGASSGDDGRYLLQNIPSGEYQIVFSLVGYERVVKQMTIPDSASLVMNVALSPREIQADAVDVVASYEDEWKEYLPRFRAELFGASRHIDRCQILNPEVLQFSTDPTGMVLHARADSSLIIENYGLGYRITLQLERFLSNYSKGHFEMVGYALFQDLPARDDHQREEWQQNRQKSYRASLRYFLSNLVKRKLDETGYRLTKGTLQELIRGKGEEIEEESITVKPNPRRGYFAVNFNAPFLRIDPQQRLGDWPSSLFQVIDLPVASEPQGDQAQGTQTFRLPPTRVGRFRDLMRTDQVTIKYESTPVSVGIQTPVSTAIISTPAGSITVNERGDILSSRTLTLRGWWANRRFADELPKDYSPEKER
ncbi:MAG: carboxypeptidase-like regulatory domain-containing protein [bacterium]